MQCAALNHCFSHLLALLILMWSAATRNTLCGLCLCLCGHTAKTAELIEMPNGSDSCGPQGRSRRSGHGLSTFSATKFLKKFFAFQSHSSTPHPFLTTALRHYLAGQLFKSRLRPWAQGPCIWCGVHIGGSWQIRWLDTMVCDCLALAAITITTCLHSHKKTSLLKKTSICNIYK